MISPLWQACKQGDPQARETLILQHLGYARLTVKRAVPKVPAAIDPEDLHAEATLALIRAVDRFDPQRGVEFKTYAIALMHGAVLDYLRRDDWVPRSVRGLQKRLEAAELALTVAGRPITPEALADHLGIDVDRLTQLQAIATPRLPLSVEAILAMDDEAGRERLTVTDPACGPAIRPKKRTSPAFPRSSWSPVSWLAAPREERSSIPSPAVEQSAE